MTKHTWHRTRLQLTLALLAIAALIASRLLPHVHNFSLVNASCLLAGAALVSRWQAIALPFIAIALSDFLLNNFIYPEYYQEQAIHLGSWTLVSYQALWQFAAYLLIVGLGFLAHQTMLSKPVSLIKLVPGSLALAVAASLSFFFISNFAVWYLGDFYPKSIEGLALCFSAAIPFYHSTLVSDLLFTPLLFTGWLLFSPALTNSSYRSPA